MRQNNEGDPSTHRAVLSAEERDAALAAAVDLTLTLDETGLIQDVVDDGKPTLDYQADKLTGEPVTALFVADAAHSSVFDVTSAQAFRNALLDGGSETVTVPLKGADGSVVSLALTPTPRLEADGTICVGREVSAYVSQIPGDISQTNFLESIGDPLFAIDAEDRFERFNAALVEYTGYERDELLGRELAEILPAREYNKLTAKLQSLVADDTRQSDTVEAPFITKDGKRVLTEAHLSALRDENGNYAGSVGVLRDIRDRKQREQNLDVLKQVLTRVFRHNVRNALTVIKGHTELLENEIEGELRNHTDTILRTTDRVLSHSEKARLIEQVIETDDLSERDITETIDEVVQTARERHPEATITVDRPSEAVVRSHPDIASAIEELVENAIEHAPPDAEPRVDIWLDERDGTRTLFVEDESGGLAEQEIHVLDRGMETDLEHSSGVGLWLIRWLVEYSDAEMIVHRTDCGSLMGIRFDQSGADKTPPSDIDASPLTTAPAQVRNVSPERFRGDAVIGRVEVVDQLEEIYESLERTGGHSVVLTGEAGIGKTTVVEQFRDELAERDDPPLVATGLCNPDVQPPYHAVRQLLTDVPSDRDVSEILADAASLTAEDPDELQQRKRVLFDDIAAELRAVAAEQPLIMLVEDMQWADSGTISLYEYLVEEVGQWGHPILFIGTYRTSDVEQTHPVIEIAETTAAAGRGTVLELDPFGHDEVEALLSYMLDVETVPESFVRTIHDHTGGTPLFVNELGRHLVDTLAPVETGSDLPDTLDELAVPETVESAIADRIEALPSEVWPVLRLGAVVGQEFSFDTLRVACDESEDALVDAIDTLVRRRIWTRTAERIGFIHGIVREQTLERITSSERDVLHRDVADALETVYSDSLDDYASELAHHYEQCGAIDEAVEWYRRAGDRAKETFAQDDAIDQYERALELARTNSFEADRRADMYADIAAVQRQVSSFERAREIATDGMEIAADRSREACRLLAVETEALNALGNYEEARATASRLREVAEELDNDKFETQACLKLGEIFRSQGEYDRAMQQYEDGASLIDELDAPQLKAECLRGMGTVLVQQGEYGRAGDRFEESLEIAAADDYESGKLSSLHDLGVVYMYQGDFEQSIDRYERTLEKAREIGDRQREAESLCNLGIIFYQQGEYSRARDNMTRGLTLLEEAGARPKMANQYNNLSLIEYRQGNYERAAELNQRSLDLKRELEDRRGVVMSRFNLGRIALARGEYDRAGELFERGLETAREIGFKRGEGLHSMQFGKLALRRETLDDALDHLEYALELMTETGNPKYQIQIHRGLGRIAVERSEYETAAEHFATATELLEDAGLEFEGATVAVAKAELALARGETDTARDHVRSALEVVDRLDLAPLRGQCERLLGQIDLESDEPASAIDHLETAVSIFREIGAAQETLATCNCLVETTRAHNDPDTALDWCRTARDVVDEAPDSLATQHEEWIAQHISDLA